MITKLNRSSYAGWQQQGEHHNNEFQNSDRPSILLKLKKKKKKTLMLPYYPSPHDLLLQQCCTQNGKRSIKGSLLTSRFWKCYGLVNDSWRSSVFNCSCNSNVNWLCERKNENKWKSFERKTALKNKKKEIRHVWNTSKLVFNCLAKPWRIRNPKS